MISSDPVRNRALRYIKCHLAKWPLDEDEDIMAFLLKILPQKHHGYVKRAITSHRFWIENKDRLMSEYRWQRYHEKQVWENNDSVYRRMLIRNRSDGFEDCR